MSVPAIIYLARIAEGDAPFLAFIESYLNNKPDIPHDFVVIFKGNQSPLKDSPGYLHLLEESNFLFSASDRMTALTACFEIAASLINEKLIFLNTFSRFLSPDWLSIYMRHLANPSIGLVGATGSYESMSSDYCRNHPATWKVWSKDMRDRLRDCIDFPFFPNPHIRSNAFGLKADTISTLKKQRFQTKREEYRFESGRNSLTKQVSAMGLKPVVVGRDGKAYSQFEWFNSNTFRNSEQENLLIADNQTDTYLNADSVLRGILAHHAWRI